MLPPIIRSPGHVAPSTILVPVNYLTTAGQVLRGGNLRIGERNRTPIHQVCPQGYQCEFHDFRHTLIPGDAQETKGI